MLGLKDISQLGCFLTIFFFLQKLRIYGLINVIKLAQHYNYTRKKKVKKLNFYFSQMSQTNSFFYEFHKYSNYTNNNWYLFDIIDEFYADALYIGNQRDLSIIINYQYKPNLFKIVEIILTLRIFRFWQLAGSHR